MINFSDFIELKLQNVFLKVAGSMLEMIFYSKAGNILTFYFCFNFINF